MSDDLTLPWASLHGLTTVRPEISIQGHSLSAQRRNGYSYDDQSQFSRVGLVVRIHWLEARDMRDARFRPLIRLTRGLYFFRSFRFGL